MAKINDWLSIDKNSGTGNSYITLTASSYEGLQDRATSLKVKTEGKEVILNIRQTAFVNHFALNKNLISPVWEGGEYSNYVVSNIGWSYTSSEWLSLSVTNGSVGRTEFNVVVQPNTSEEVRIGYVNIVSNNGATLGTIKVAQASHNEVNNIIFYTSTDGKKITPYSSTGVVANEYVDGVGALYYGNTITEVPQNLFRDRDTLASVSVPETVTTIKSGAFYSCDKLVSYDFPDTLTTIGADAFRYCKSLTVFDFPSVETIGNYAFNECPFETVILSDTLRTTGTGVFQTCTKLKTIQIGSGLTSISDSLCNGCTSLEAIDIPTTIKRIEGYAFQSCSKLETLYLHGGIEYIGYRAFLDNKLKSVTLEERTSVLENGGSPFYTSTGYMTDAYVTDIKSWFLWQPILFTYNNVVRNLYVNGELLTEVVTPTDYNIVPEFAFRRNPHITRVVVTDNVTSVERGAFNGLSNANYLYLGSGAGYDSGSNSDYKSFTDFDGTLELKNTDSKVLENNYFTKVVFMSNTTVTPKSHTIQEIEFRGDVLSVSCAYNNGYDTFKNVTRVVVNCNQLHIGSHLLCNASLLTEFDFSKVVSIGESAFESTSVTELTNAPLLTSIGNYAFMDSSITELTNAPLLTSIGCLAFIRTKLKTVNLSNSPLTYIDKDAFSSCTELTEVILPSTSYNIKDYVFNGCSNLKHIKMVAEDIETEIIEGARITGVYDTGVGATVDSRLEFDYKYTQSPSGDGYYEVIGAGNTDDDNVFQIRIQNNVFHFHIGSSQFGVSNITPNVFHHFVVSLDEGVIIDGVQKGVFSRSNYTINAPFYINGIQYSPNRHANGEFGTIKIDDVVIVPQEDGFYNGDIKLETIKDGVYEYYNEVIVKNEPAIPTINNNTFYGIAQYGFLEYPLELDYTPWLSTNSYYLGYYNWNRFKLSATELDFDAADTYEVTVENGIPSTWEITQLPFWLTASVMSGGEGTTTITFTKTEDYVESSNITFTIFGVNYKITAKYTIREFDFLKSEEYNFNIDNLSSKDITISGKPSWLDAVIDGDNVTLRKNSNWYVYTEGYTYLVFNNGRYVFKWKQDGNLNRLPKSANRIYYTTTDGQSLYRYFFKYNYDKPFIGEGEINGAFYFEFDGDLHNIGDSTFKDNKTLKRISLPSELVSVGTTALYNCSELIEVDCGGKEKHFSQNAISMNHYDTFSTDRKGFEMINVSKSLVYVHECGLNTLKGSISFGADLQFLGGSAFGNCRGLNRIDFYGMTPPQFGLIHDWQSQADYGPFHGVNSSCEIHAPIGSDYSSAYNYGLPSTCLIIYDLEAEEPTTYDEITVFGDMPYLSPIFSSEVVYYSPVGDTSIIVGDSSKYSLNNKSIGNGWYVLSMLGVNTDVDDYYDTVTINAGELSQTFNTVVYGGMAQVSSFVREKHITLRMKNTSISSYSAIYEVTKDPVESVRLYEQERGDDYITYSVRWSNSTSDIILTINYKSDRFGRKLQTIETIDWRVHSN